MSGPSKKSWLSWRPDWLRTWWRVRALRRNLNELRDDYGPKVDAANGDAEQALLAEWSFEAAWPESELAQIESAKLHRQAYRWNIEAPASSQDTQTGHWYIAHAARTALKREIRDARRESIRWWVQVVVMPLIALVSSVTALISVFYRLR